MFVTEGESVNFKSLIIATILLLLIGCATQSGKVKLVSGSKLPAGYELVVDNQQKFRVKCPDDFVTEARWSTQELAIQYAVVCSGSYIGKETTEENNDDKSTAYDPNGY